MELEPNIDEYKIYVIIISNKSPDEPTGLSNGSTMKNLEELTLYVTKIGVEYNTKIFIRVVSSIPKMNHWIELPKDGISKELDTTRGELMVKFFNELQPFLRNSVKKQEEITNFPVNVYRVKYDTEFLSMGSVESDREKKNWSELCIPLSDHEIYFFHSVMNLSGNLF